MSTTLEAMSVCSRSKTARCRSADRIARRARSGRFSTTERPGRGADPGVIDHRGEVHVVDVVVPVDDGRVEAEGLVVLVVEGVPELEQAVDPVAGVGLGVGPVELDVAEGTLGQRVTILDPRRQLGLLAPHRQRGQAAARRWS